MIKKLNKISTFFLDFDGVVIESASIKTDAFYDLYLSYGEEAAKFAKNYHLNHQGVNRFKKFDAIHESFLGKACSPEVKQNLSEKFSKLVSDRIFDCPLVEGILDFLKLQHKKGIPVFLLSATPQDELLRICEKRELSKFFKEIYGAPFEKSERGEYLIYKHLFSQDEVIFIGDSISDFKAASAIGVYFIGRVQEGDESPFKGEVPVIKDFRELLL